MNCIYCHYPMWLSYGQIAYFHGLCRTLGRKKYGRAPYRKAEDFIVKEKPMTLWQKFVQWIKNLIK